MIDTAFRKEFPFFQQNPDLCYLDSASTTQKPRPVIDAVTNYLHRSVNTGRSNYRLATQLTGEIAAVRHAVAQFINASTDEEIIFTSGATEGLNLVAQAWGRTQLSNGDEVLYCADDHESTVRPWQQLQRELAKSGTAIRLVPFRVTNEGEPSINDILSKVTDRTRLIVLTHIHNVFGGKADVERLRSALSDGVTICLDASQSISHIPIDTQDLDVDFLAFSGHKLFASTGTGVLWAHRRLHSQLAPGSAGDTRHGTGVPLFARFEVGTPNILGILSLGAAIRFIDSIGISAIQNRVLRLTLYLIERLRGLHGIEFLPGAAHSQRATGYGIVSFRLAGQTPADVGFALNQANIMVRTGNHCTLNDSEANNSIRISLHAYNEESEIDQLVAALKTITS